MKRKRSKQLAGLCLLLSAALSLCACGRSATESGKENDALAKEYVYRFQEIAMPDFGGNEYEVCASDYRDRKIFLLMKGGTTKHSTGKAGRFSPACPSAALRVLITM